MEKLEESQRLAEEQWKKKAEEEKRKQLEGVVHPLYSDAESAPAVVHDSGDTTARKSLPS
jgi:hypothetical protein